MCREIEDVHSVFISSSRWKRTKTLLNIERISIPVISEDISAS
jgi:hypothetical protein